MFGWSQTLLCCFVIVTSAFPEGHIDSENVTVAAEPGAGGRIAGGEKLDGGPSAAPFQVQITREGATFCSGAIVSRLYIVTAAHCVEGARPEELTVRIGSNIRGKGPVVPIEKIVQHPDYDYPQNNFDIAYMRTEFPMPFSPTIRPAYIAFANASLPRNLHVTGWGYQEDNQMKLADKIRAVDLPVISNTECQVFYPMMSITKNMICGYSLEEMDKGTCVGDGGDPASSNVRLYGVSSATRGCGPGMAPSVFTNVDAEEIRTFILNGISRKPSHRPRYSAERLQRPSKRPEKYPDESSETPLNQPEEESAKRPERHPVDRPEKATPESDSENPEECPEKVAKTPADDSDYYEEHPGYASKSPERPLIRPEGEPPKRPERPSKCTEEAAKTPESDSENPEECPEKVAKTPADDLDYYEEHPGDASKRPERPLIRPEGEPPKRPERPSKRPEEAAKTPESGTENPDVSPEKVAKTPADDSDYYEEHPGDASKRPAGVSNCPVERPGDLLSKRPEEDPTDRPEELSKGPQRQPADRPQKRPVERGP